MANSDILLQPPRTTSIIYCAGSEVRDTCVRPTLVMEAGEGEQRGEVRFILSNDIRSEGSIAIAKNST